MHPAVRGVYNGFVVHVMISLLMAAFSENPFNYLAATAIATGAAVGGTWAVNRQITRTNDKEYQWH